MEHLFNRDQVLKAAQAAFNAIHDKRERDVAEFKTFSGWKRWRIEWLPTELDTLYGREHQEQRTLDIAHRLMFKAQAGLKYTGLGGCDTPALIALTDDEIDVIIPYWESAK